MINFLHPAWLWGLTGLTIPVAIHLLSRKEGKVIYVGSVRHLTDSVTAQFSSIRLNEILLLVIRMLLLTLLVFLLAGSQLTMSDRTNTKWVVIENGVERQKLSSSVIDSALRNGFELRYLSSGFPITFDSISSQKKDYRALAQQLGFV